MFKSATDTARSIELKVLSNDQPVLSCLHLRKSFGSKVAVEDVSFQVFAGECYGLLGPNGAGKTTSISILCGLIGTDYGEVKVCGENMEQWTIAPRAYIGYVPQEIALYPELSSIDNLKFFGKLYGLRGKRLKNKIDEVLEIVGLTERAKDRISTFSGGMKRRINIAAGLLHDPRLLVLDEPTVGVDPQSRNAILTTIESLRDGGIAILYTTHYMEEASRLCHRIGIIDKGSVIAEGTLQDLVESYSKSDQILIEVKGTADNLYDCLRAELCSNVIVKNGTTFIVNSKEPDKVFDSVLQVVKNSGVQLIRIEQVQPNLEDVFLNLTGRELRD